MIGILLLHISCSNKISQVQIEKVKIYGNCGMCKTNIEAAGSIDKVAMVEWNVETKMATLTFNKTKTNREEILKRIALAGYDSDLYLAPDDVYANLHGCCQYERVTKHSVKVASPEYTTMDETMEKVSPDNHSQHDKTIPGESGKTSDSEQKVISPVHVAEVPTTTSADHPITSNVTSATEKKETIVSEKKTTNVSPSGTDKISTTHQGGHTSNAKVKTTNTDSSNSPLKPLFDIYFNLKDALVKTDGITASSKAKDLMNAIKSIKMETLANQEHLIWMKSYKKLTSDAEAIANTKDVKKQRNSFISLSSNMYELMKASKYDTEVYYQHCPMANDGKGANWLSKEKAVKNPYYGNEMLTCGKVIEKLN